MTRLEIATDIISISNVTAQPILVNRSIQHALERVFEFHDWPYYIQDKGVIQTVATYGTGTVSVTNGSPNLTFSGATLTSNMAGRKIRINDETPYYRIKSVNTGAGTAVLENNYCGSDNALANFTIYKDEFRLNADVDKYKLLRQSNNGVIVFDTHPTDFDSVYPMPNAFGDPITSIMIGTKLDTYSTGTVVSSGTTLTGTSTAWTTVEGLGRMSNIRIGTNVYTVKSVDSDTQITTYEGMANASGASYEITLNNILVQLHDIPDEAKLLYYRYFRLPDLLVNDYDIPDMPHSWHWVLMYGGLSIILMQKGDINKAQIEAETRFIDGLNMMKLKLGSFSPDRIYKRKSIDRIRGNINGLEKGNFDRRWSMPY